jgi:hypothetical protein
VRVFGDDVKALRDGKRGGSYARAVRIGFDSRPASKAQALGHYAGRLLEALRETASEGVEIVETHRPYAVRGRRVDLFHAPWMEGAVLRSPCPTVVTLHDLDALTRRSERLRRGAMHMRLRHLALQRATRVIVHSEQMAQDALAKIGLERERVVVIPQAVIPQAAQVACAGSDERPVPGENSGWDWEDVARATWEVYERALSEPPRPFISRPRAASRQREPS